MIKRNLKPGHEQEGVIPPDMRPYGFIVFVILFAYLGVQSYFSAGEAGPSPETTTSGIAP